MNSDPLATWSDGGTKRAIIDFVAAVRGEGDTPPVPAAQRVATFDNDGTLWCEKPVPVQLDFILSRLVEMADSDPALRERQPWKAAHDGDRAWLGGVIDDHYKGDDTNLHVLAAGILQGFVDLTVEEFELRAEQFLRSASHPTLGRSYLETAYAPMVELLGYLADNDFTNYIASGGGRDFMRPVSEELYGIPRERVIGSSTTFTYRGGVPGGSITHTAKPDYLDDGPEKPIRIWDRVGRRPLLACGNSNGDVPMLEYAHHGELPTLKLLVVHDDADREFAYTTGADAAIQRAAREQWTRISVAADWTRVF